MQRRDARALVPVTTGYAHAVTADSVSASQRREHDAVRDWLLGQVSEQTRRAYAGDLRGFMRWASAQGVHTLADVTRGHVIAYRDALRAEGYSVATIARKLSCLRKLLETGLADGWLASNPAKFVRSERVPDVSPRHALDVQSVRALLAAPNQTTLKGAREYALLAVLLHLGLRRSEVAGLRLGDLGRERSHITLRVKGKGSKVRLLPMPPHVHDAIRAYLQMDGRADATEGPLFRPLRNPRYGTLDKALSSDAVWRVVTSCATATGLADLAHLDVHTLRHTALTQALDGGASLRRVQAMAGQADPKTTARYDSRRGDLDHSAVYHVRYA